MRHCIKSHPVGQTQIHGYFLLVCSRISTPESLRNTTQVDEYSWTFFCSGSLVFRRPRRAAVHLMRALRAADWRAAMLGVSVQRLSLKATFRHGKDSGHEIPQEKKEKSPKLKNPSDRFIPFSLFSPISLLQYRFPKSFLPVKLFGSARLIIRLHDDIVMSQRRDLVSVLYLWCGAAPRMKASECELADGKYRHKIKPVSFFF